MFHELTLHGRLFPTDGVAYKKKISDQVSACTHREDREWKYQKKSVAGGLVYACMLYVTVLKSVLLSHLLSFTLLQITLCYRHLL